MSEKESVEYTTNTVNNGVFKEKREVQLEDPGIKLEETQAIVDATIAKEQEKIGVKETFWSKYKGWIIGAGTVGLGAWLLKPWKWFSDNKEGERELKEDGEEMDESNKKK